MAVKTTTTELDRSRVRVDVEVEPAAVEKELDAAAKDLAREMKMPGFRKGKVPAEVVLRQLGPRGRARPGAPARAAGLVRGGCHATPAWRPSATRSST